MTAMAASAYPDTAYAPQAVREYAHTSAHACMQMNSRAIARTCCAHALMHTRAYVRTQANARMRAYTDERTNTDRCDGAGRIPRGRIPTAGPTPALTHSCIHTCSCHSNVHATHMFIPPMLVVHSRNCSIDSRMHTRPRAHTHAACTAARPPVCIAHARVRAHTPHTRTHGTSRTSRHGTARQGMPVSEAPPLEPQVGVSSVYACICAHVRTCAHMRACTHACARACVRKCVDLGVCSCTCSFVRACVYLCVRACVHLCVHARPFASTHFP